MDSPTSDTPRQSLLGSINFLARSSRPRAVTGANSNNPEPTPVPPNQLLPSSISLASPGHRRRTNPAQPPPPPPIQTNPSNSGLGYMLRRRRSATALPDAQSQRTATPAAAPEALPAQPAPSTHRIRLVPHLESNRSLHFDAITRDVRQGDSPLRIGRFTDRSAHSGNSSNKLAFKSKVVSRGHAEIWFDAGSFFIKDTKSSSGTFLNHIRLSSPNTESRPHPVKDGDILQLGVDYQGGTEEIYRCVKMRIELGREWQSGVNAFNSNALMQLKTLSGAVPAKKDPAAAGPAEKRSKSNLTDCCICLFQVTVCQSLFIAPCSHVYHYKCIRPLLEMHHPGFSCPLCRTFADLEADVEIEAPAPEPEAPADDEDAEVDVVGVESSGERGGDVEMEDTTESRAPSPPLPAPRPFVDISAAVAVPIPRRRSAEGGFPGAEATPLNNTFLATLAARALANTSGEGSAALGAIAMSDEEEDDDDEGSGSGGGEEEGVEETAGTGAGAGVGAKRKR